METNLQKSIELICQLLHRYAVQYIIVGGTAVAFNGYYRHSINADGEITEKPDIDIWYNPTYENYYKILKVMKALGQDITEFEDEQTPDPSRSFFRLDFTYFSLDLLPAIRADIKFGIASDRKETIDMNGIKIHFMSYTDLIEDKKASARQKDIEDIKQLRNLHGK